jgi:rhodanese-related sulfurtransferase
VLPQRLVRACSSSSSSGLADFLEHPDVVVIDVRTQEEYEAGHIRLSKNIPVQEIPDRLGELPEDLSTPVCVFCRIGQRSGLAKNLLEQVGYSNVVNGMTLERVAQSMEEDIVQS